MKRSLSKSLVALAVAMAAVGLSACQGNGSNSASGTAASGQETKTQADSTEAAGQAGAGEGQTGGKALQLAMISEGNGDRVTFPWQNRVMATNLMFRSLLIAEPDLTTVNPDLAESYQISDDGLTYTFVMKDGLKWSDGQPLTADDVAFSIKTNLRAAVSNGIYTSAFMKITGAQEWKDGGNDLSGIKVDQNKITITLSEPYAAFAPVMAQFAILPEHSLKDANPLELHNNDFWIKPVCDGIYMVDEMNAGNYFTMVPNPNYEGKAPKISKAVVYWVTDFITTAQAGKLDYIFTNAPDQINEFDKLSYMQKTPIDILYYRYFVCNMKGADGNQNPVMENPKVREALLYAIDRKALASQMYPGLATVVNSGLPVSYPENNGKEYEYNPEKAKELLKEANFDFSKTFRILYYYTDQTTIDLMDAVAYYLEQVGMKVQTVQSQQGTTDLYQTRNYDIGYKGLSAFTIDEYYAEYLSNNANFKQIFGGDPQFDNMVDQLGTVTDPAKHSDILKQLEAKEQEDLFKLPLFTIGNMIYINSDHVKIPESVKFCNPWYMCDLDFADWELK